MKVYIRKEDIKEVISKLKLIKKSIGFFPTMGALHKGHISLINKSIQENDITIVSIFVNPTQFNEQNDFKNYPRNIDNDLDILETTNCDIVFSPTERDIYSERHTPSFDFQNLTSVMEGKHRKGHFEGIAQIVSILFSLIKPDKAYFGRKDFQQYVVIKELTKQMGLTTQIIAGTTVRDVDKLAFSSRNVLLTKEQRKDARCIPLILFEAKKLVGKLSVEDLKKWVKRKIEQNGNIVLEYFEIVDDEKLKDIKSWEEKNTKIACIAVKVDKIRLIDNVILN